MIRHELYFQKQRDASLAFHFLTILTLEGVLSEYQVTFFTNRALTLLEQVIILAHSTPDGNLFNIHEV